MTNNKQYTGRVDPFMQRSLYYREMLAEREEIARFKWLESEKAGMDIGYERALMDWVRKHRDDWRQAWRKRELGH
jgi:hypothetical protein